MSACCRKRRGNHYMKTTTSVTSLAQSPPARFLAMVSHVATPINQLGVGVARQVKIVTRLALFGTKLRRALTVAALIAVGAATGPAPAFAIVSAEYYAPP